MFYHSHFTEEKAEREYINIQDYRVNIQGSIIQTPGISKNSVL